MSPTNNSPFFYTPEGSIREDNCNKGSFPHVSRRFTVLPCSPSVLLRQQEQRMGKDAVRRISSVGENTSRRSSMVITPLNELRRSSKNRRLSRLAQDILKYQSPEILLHKKKASVDMGTRVTFHTDRKPSVNSSRRKSSTTALLMTTRRYSGASNQCHNTSSASQSNITPNARLSLDGQVQSFSGIRKQSIDSVSSNRTLSRSCIKPNQKLSAGLLQRVIGSENAPYTPPNNYPPLSPLENSVFSSHTVSSAPRKRVSPFASSTFKSPPSTSVSPQAVSPSFKSPLPGKQSEKEMGKQEAIQKTLECKDNISNHADLKMMNSSSDGNIVRKKSVAFNIPKFLTPAACRRKVSVVYNPRPRFSLSSLLADYQLKRKGSVPSTPLFSIHDTVHLPQISLGRVLGTGGFGQVYQGTYQNRLVAVKRMHSITKNQRARVASYKAELNAMRLHHPNIVNILTSGCTDNLHGDAYIVMEYVGDRNLAAVLNDPAETISLSRRVCFGADIATALRFIHANCIIHLDVKPANVILTPNGSCKLGDFGCCQVQ